MPFHQVLFADPCVSSSQTNPPALLGSSKSISEHDVRATIEGISDFDHVLVDSFEFESVPSSIPIIKGRLRAHYNFWSHTLEADNFILRVIDKGYAIPFISVPPKVLFCNNTSALTHADFVGKADSICNCLVAIFPFPKRRFLVLN